VNFPALDVALGLLFVYFVLALVCSGIGEAISSFARWRAQDLERGLWELFRNHDAEDSEDDAKKAVEALERLKKHPLIQPMLYPKYKPQDRGSTLQRNRLKTNRKTDFPSYIPSRTFVAALLGLEQKAVAVANDEDLRDSLRKVDESINEIPSEPVKQALTALLHSAQGDAIAFRRTAEQWFDDHMERVSGWYRRRIQLVLWILSVVVAVVINADSLQIAKHLWVEPSVRASLVNQAQAATNQPAGETNPSEELESLSVPLGWHFETARDDPQGFPFYDDPHMVWDLLSKLLGLAITAVALTFGAPFWFDTLSKLARLRNSGAPPPASDAIRKGEGEETRLGESAVQSRTLVEAAGKSPETEASQ
jgi:hypothetical protein